MSRSQLTIGMSLIFAISFAIAAGVPVPATGDDDGVEEVENVEVVGQTPAGGASEGSGGANLGLMQIIGRNHPAAVHIPIGMLIALCLIEFLALIRPGWEMGKSGMVLSVATALSFIPAAISGFLRASEVFAGGEPTPLLIEHRNIMIAAFTIFLVSLGLRVAKKDRLNGAIRYVYLALLAVSLVLVGIGGHHGGQMVYGESYLPY
jgi:uncharacterized membrane protein